METTTGTYPGHAGAPIAYLHYAPTAGTADPPLVIVHGTLSFADDWAEVARRCAERSGRAVFVPYLRGRAPSAPLGPDFDLTVAVSDLVALLDRTGRGTALFGHSLGAVIAALGALERPDLGALVLYEPPLPVDRPFAGGALARIRAALDRADPDAAMRTIGLDVVGDPGPAVAEFIGSEFWPPRRVLVPTSYAELAAIDALTGIDPGRFAAITAPTTVLLGELSDRLPFGPPSRALAAAIPGAALVGLPGQGHYANLMAPADLADEVVAALEAPVGVSHPS